MLLSKNASVKKQNWKIDYKRFRIWLKDKYSITKAFVFIGYIEKNAYLYQNLKRSGFTLIFKPTVAYRDGRVKGNCDSELVMHVMIEWFNFDQAVLVTADGDFYSLCKYLVKHEKMKRILIPDRSSYSILLRRLLAHITYLNDSSIKQKIGRQ